MNERQNHSLGTGIVKGYGERKEGIYFSFFFFLKNVLPNICQADLNSHMEEGSVLYLLLLHFSAECIHLVNSNFAVVILITSFILIKFVRIGREGVIFDLTVELTISILDIDVKYCRSRQEFFKNLRLNDCN